MSRKPIHNSTSHAACNPVCETIALANPMARPGQSKSVVRSGSKPRAAGCLEVLHDASGGTHVHWHVEASTKPLHPMWSLTPITAGIFAAAFQEGLKKHVEARQCSVGRLGRVAPAQ